MTLLLSCDSDTKRLESFEVHGIDVSHYQAEVNWEMVAQQDIHFAFIKASEGETYRDSFFLRNWEEMKDVGIMRGAYHFFRPTLSAQAQAENFAEFVSLEEGDLPPVLDVELMDGTSKVDLLNGVRTWLYSVEIKLGIKPIIYTNQKFYHQYLAGHFDDYPIWIARYNHRQPHLPGGKEWDFWQYGNRGKLQGVYGDVDFNVFRGTREELEAFGFVRPPVLSMVGY